MIVRLSALLLAAGALFAAQQQNFDNVRVRVEHVRGNIYMLAGDGGNITLQFGKDGILLVDSGYAPVVPKVMTEIRKLTPAPLAFLINTHMHPDHVGGNAEFAKLAPQSGFLGTPPGGELPFKMVAHENVFNRLAAAGQTFPAEGLPTTEYFTPAKNLHVNGEAIIIMHPPNAHTDGDSMVLFRGSDVLSTGDIFTPGAYPFIDVDRGGSVQGEIAALNQALQLAVPAHTQEGGTYVIPGHGRVCDNADVVEFRDMIVIVRDRVRDLIGKGQTLEQIKAAKLTRDYDTEYLAPNSFVTADAFVEAVYKSLTKK